MKKEGKLGEVLRFVITGGACFVIEFAALVLLRDTVGLDTLVVVPIAFTISVIANYLMCVRWVFHAARDQKGAVKAGFFITSLIGLVLNEALMLLFRILFGEDGVLFTVFSFTVTMYMLNKAMATLLVMVWNYFTKRAMLTRKKRSES